MGVVVEHKMETTGIISGLHRDYREDKDNNKKKRTLNLLYRILGLYGVRGISQKVENQMEKKIENEMETGVIIFHIAVILGLYWDNGE